MDRLVPIFNKLMQIVAETSLPELELEIPRIVVVGAQSSGKSSVLEAIIQREFLPRGNGMVTRCPLVLHLQKENTSSPEWGEFSHLVDKKGILYRFDDFDKIREEIERRTLEIAGEGKKVSGVSINLTIHSPKVLNLILVDLPGLTKNTDVGEDIPKQIYEMSLNYIKCPNTIILAVSAANVDLEVSPGIEIARKVDQEGVRTLGVLTKLDMMGAETDATKELMNEVIRLKLGYIGVKLRSQKDMNTHKSLEISCREEEEWFDAHTEYSGLRDKCGTSCLLIKLSGLFIEQLRMKFPLINEQIFQLLKENEKEQRLYGGTMNKDMQSDTMLYVIQKFTKAFDAYIDGQIDDTPSSSSSSSTSSNFFFPSSSSSFSSFRGKGGGGGGSSSSSSFQMQSLPHRLKGGARIIDIIRTIFVDELGKLNFDLGLNDADLKTEIKNAQGRHEPMFFSDNAFIMFSQSQIERLRAPCMHCLNLVYSECVSVVTSAVEAVDREWLKRFPALRKTLLHETKDILNTKRECAAQEITRMIDVEKAFINARHPNLNRFAVFQEVLQSRKDTSCWPDDEDFNAEVVRRLVGIYYNIIRSSITDTIPKYVMSILVLEATDLFAELSHRLLNNETRLRDVLTEDPEIEEKRKQTAARHAALKKAADMLEEVSLSEIFRESHGLRQLPVSVSTPASRLNQHQHSRRSQEESEGGDEVRGRGMSSSPSSFSSLSFPVEFSSSSSLPSFSRLQPPESSSSSSSFSSSSSSSSSLSSQPLSSPLSWSAFLSKK